jgi:hypothetical protein
MMGWWLLVLRKGAQEVSNTLPRAGCAAGGAASQPVSQDGPEAMAGGCWHPDGFEGCLLVLFHAGERPLMPCAPPGTSCLPAAHLLALMSHLLALMSHLLALMSHLLPPAPACLPARPPARLPASFTLLSMSLYRPQCHYTAQHTPALNHSPPSLPPTPAGRLGGRPAGGCGARCGARRGAGGARARAAARGQAAGAAAGESARAISPLNPCLDPCLDPVGSLSCPWLVSCFQHCQHGGRLQKQLQASGAHTAPHTPPAARLPLCIVCASPLCSRCFCTQREGEHHTCRGSRMCVTA